MSDQTVNDRKDMELLLGLLAVDSKGKPISDDDKQQLIQSRLSNLITTPFLEQHKLDQDDIGIIALLLNNLLKGREGLKTTDVLTHINRSIDTLPDGLRRIRKLQELGIIQVGERHAEEDKSIASLLHSELQLSDGFLNRIFNDVAREQTVALPVMPYKDNYEYLSEQYERLQIIENVVEMAERRFGRSRHESGSADQQEEELKKLESRIAERLAKTDKVFPFEKLKVKKRLSEREALIVLGLLFAEQQNNGRRRRDDPAMVIDNLSKNQYERFLNMKLCRKGESLDKKGLIEIHSVDPWQFDDMLKLKDEIRLELLGEKKQKLSGKDIFFEFLKPSVALDNVVLAPSVSEEVRLIVNIQDSAYKRLKEWDIKGFGLVQYNASGKKGKNPSMNILFYGPPGTGKTLVAHAIAHELGKDILTLDCSKVLSRWVGGSEQNTRMIFDRYRAIAKRSENPPLVLLNEADQFLHRRLTDILRSVDQSYNQMQNIFLEQIERFEGILIATTNLVENLDTAFSRRFHHKIELKMPGIEERLKLWQIHLPRKAPLSKDVNLRPLAEHYAFSGGQIAVVVHSAVMNAAIKDHTLCQDDFIDACEKELRGNFDEKAKARIGF